MNKKAINLDSELCMRTCRKILDKNSEANLATDYPEKERVVIIVVTVAGIIDNGGFHSLFSSVLPGDPQYIHTMEAFKQIGCSKALDSIKEALSLFSNANPPDDDKLRIKLYEKNPKKLRDKIDSKFWKEYDNVSKCLANYIRTNKLSNEFNGTGLFK
ncbi:MAG: DUF4375 domain-containing protein [Nitrospiraceae bacterium]|nr:MAG: DUF4375 domain-containing protein [Nitrospiraceae bacterium]